MKLFNVSHKYFCIKKLPKFTVLQNFQRALKFNHRILLLINKIVYN